MVKRKDLTGQVFGKLTALSPSHVNKYGGWMWLCKCECGNETVVKSNSLVRGNTRSCGCLLKEKKISSREKIYEQGNIKERIGLKFGHLTIKEFAYKTKTKANKYEIYYNCICDCSNETVVSLSHLQEGHTKTCGRNCLCKEKELKNNGLTASKEYNIYTEMLQRCNNLKCKAYKWYGGRGIIVCARWQGPGGFVNFYADMGQKLTGLSLDRINNSGPYSPENCKWSTTEEQNNNKRNNIKITSIIGEVYTLKKWASVLNCTTDSIRYRLKQGWKKKCCVCLPKHYSRRRNLNEFIMK